MTADLPDVPEAAALVANITAEIERLRDGQPERDHHRTSWWEFRRRAWLDGVGCTRAVLADRLEALLVEQGWTPPGEERH